MVIFEDDGALGIGGHVVDGKEMKAGEACGRDAVAVDGADRVDCEAVGEAT